jgi:hypothetical protein
MKITRLLSGLFIYILLASFTFATVAHRFDAAGFLSAAVNSRSGARVEG